MTKQFPFTPPLSREGRGSFRMKTSQSSITPTFHYSISCYSIPIAFRYR